MTNSDVALGAEANGSERFERFGQNQSIAKLWFGRDQPQSLFDCPSTVQTLYTEIGPHGKLHQFSGLPIRLGNLNHLHLTFRIRKGFEELEAFPPETIQDFA